MKRLLILLSAGVVLAGGIGAAGFAFGWFDRSSPHEWTEMERAAIHILSLENLPPLSPDPSNRVADDQAAIDLGHHLYFDTRLSGTGTFSCATCHQPDLFFTDGLAKAEAAGTAPRHTPTIVGLAYNPWFYWDGRKDSQWSQALAPLEAAVEQAGDRTLFAHVINEHYQEEYEALFGPLPDLSGLPRRAGPVEDPEIAAAWEAMSVDEQEMVNQIFANIGKAIAAYERQVMPGETRFDQYAAAVAARDEAQMAELFSEEEASGLRLFIGEANCTDCHNGPMFSNGSFHNIGLPLDGTDIDGGRIEGVAQALIDPFNCLGPYSDAAPEECAETRFAKTDGEELVGAFKTPTLRNVAKTAPYMHKGIFPDLDTVLAHYNAAPPAFPGHSDLNPLDFDADALAQLRAFLLTLNGEPDMPPNLLQDPFAAASN